MLFGTYITTTVDSFSDKWGNRYYLQEHKNVFNDKSYWYVLVSYKDSTTNYPFHTLETAKAFFDESKQVMS